MFACCISSSCFAPLFFSEPDWNPDLSNTEHYIELTQAQRSSEHKNDDQDGSMPEVDSLHNRNSMIWYGVEVVLPGLKAI
jgi:hypothetical protein